MLLDTSSYSWDDSTVPLSESLQTEVRAYVLKHVVPKTINTRPPDDMIWFSNRFSFVSDSALRTHLAETWWQARFVGRLQEALGFSEKINRTFRKQQIFLYASIFEAVIDLLLGANPENVTVKEMLLTVSLAPRRGALGKNASLMYEGAALIPCEEKRVHGRLRDARFPDKLTTAIAIGAVKVEHEALISSIYTNRNNIHISRAAAHNFEPDQSETYEAYRTLFAFLEHAAAFLPQQQGA